MTSNIGDKDVRSLNGIHKHMGDMAVQNKVNLSINGISLEEPTEKSGICKREENKSLDISQCPYMKSQLASKNENSENEQDILNKFSGDLAQCLIHEGEIKSAFQNNNEILDEKPKHINLQTCAIGQCHSIASLSSLGSESGSKNALNEDLENPNYVVAEHLGITYLRYRDETQMPEIMRLITKDLSEPYSIYTYRYFIHNWPHLCFLVSKVSFVISFCVVLVAV